MAITLSLCCNDRNGNFTGKACQLEFDPITCNFEFGDGCGPDGVSIEFLGKREGSMWHWVRIGTEELEYFRRGSHVGNIFWDAISISGVDTIRLINSLMAVPDIGCVEAETFIYEHFKARRAFNWREYQAWSDAQKVSA